LPVFLRPSAWRLFCFSASKPRLVSCGLCLRLQLSLGLSDLGDPLLLVGNPVGQFVTSFVAVQLVVFGICGLSDAFALILVPSSATCPSRTSPGFLGQLQHLHEHPSQLFEVPLAMVRKSGASRAAIIMKSARWMHALAMRREE
jgi:hypothetical protein